MERGLWLRQRVRSPRDSKLPCSLRHACIIDPAQMQSPGLQFLKAPQEPLKGACRGHSLLELSGRERQDSAGGDEMLQGSVTPHRCQPQPGPAGDRKADRSWRWLGRSSPGRRLCTHCVLNPCRSAAWARPLHGRGGGGPKPPGPTCPRDP